MKHYFNPKSRAATTNWMLRELNAAHEQVMVDFAVQDDNLSEMHRINPMKKLPVLADGDVVITEVAAICAYLADKFPEKKLAPAVGTAERGAYYRYLFVAGNTIEPIFTLSAADMVHPHPSYAGWGDMPRVMATIEALTPEREWALGAQFTAADVVFGGLLDYGIKFGWFEPSAKVAAYVARIRQRPCYLQSHPDAVAEVSGSRIA